MNYTNIYIYKDNYLVHQDNKGELVFFNKIKSLTLVKYILNLYFVNRLLNMNLFTKLNIDLKQNYNNLMFFVLFLNLDIYFVLNNILKPFRLLKTILLFLLIKEKTNKR